MSRPPNLHTVESHSRRQDGSYLLRLIAPHGTAVSAYPIEAGKRVSVVGGIASEYRG